MYFPKSVQLYTYMFSLYYFIVRAIDLGIFKFQFELTCLYMKQLPDIAIKLGIAVCLDDYLSVCL